MNWVVDLFAFLISLAILSKSSHLAIKSAIKISKITRLGEMVIGFLFLSFLTSVPELFISLVAIKSTSVDISIGNILGSNLANICIILGILALIKPLRITEKSLRKILSVLAITSLILTGLLVTYWNNKLIGIVLVLFFMAFIYYSKKEKITIEKLKERESPRTFIFKIEFYEKLLILIFSIIFVFISSRFVVVYASNIARFLNLPEILVGATIIGVGTSLPELSTSWAAVREKHVNLALGNIIGSCLINVTLVLGFVFIFSPLSIDFAIFSEMTYFVLLSTMLLWVFLGSFGRGKLDRREGLILLVLYILFMFYLFEFKAIEVPSFFI